MKTLFFSVIKFCLLLVLTFSYYFETYAQNVCDAQNNDFSTTLDNSVSHKSQSNDLFFNDCENFLAVVNSYGIYWQYNIDHCGSPNAFSDDHITHLPLTPSGFQEVRNADVAIVFDNRYQFNDVYYALVVYFNPDNLNYYLVVYEFDGTSLNINGSPIQLKQLSGTTPPDICNIRVDANTNVMPHPKRRYDRQ